MRLFFFNTIHDKETKGCRPEDIQKIVEMMLNVQIQEEELLVRFLIRDVKSGFQFRHDRKDLQFQG